MKGLRPLLAAIALAAAPAFACLNSYEEEMQGLMYRGDPTEITASVVRLEAAYQARPTIEGANDLGVAQVLAGNYGRAIEVLTALEKQQPGLSRTASNLGTALELAGRHPEALHWIKEGIRRDPADHSGSEWVHVRILEAKLALARDPAWLKTHGVLSIDFGTAPRPQAPATPPRDHLGLEHSLEDVRRAIAYQLQERLKFVTPPDPVVGSLYFTWASIDHLLDLGFPPDQYRAALHFGAENAALIESRVAQYERTHQPPAPPPVQWGGPLAVLSAIVALLVALGMLIKRRRSRTAVIARPADVPGQPPQ